LIINLSLDLLCTILAAPRSHILFIILLIIFFDMISRVKHKRLFIFSMLFSLLISFFSPISTILAQTAPENPKSNHVPQITVPAPGGVKVNTWNGNLFYPMQLMKLPARG